MSTSLTLRNGEMPYLIQKGMVCYHRISDISMTAYQLINYPTLIFNS